MWNALRELYIGQLGLPLAVSTVRRRDSSAMKPVGRKRNTMLKRTAPGALCAAALLVAGAAYTQDRATLTLRSGVRVASSEVIQTSSTSDANTVQANQPWTSTGVTAR